jgi:hypothetical protein
MAQLDGRNVVVIATTGLGNLADHAMVVQNLDDDI